MATVFVGEIELECAARPEIQCQGDHGAKASPVVRSTDEYQHQGAIWGSATDLAWDSGWVRTDAGWWCPDARHGGDLVTPYEVITQRRGRRQRRMIGSAAEVG